MPAPSAAATLRAAVRGFSVTRAERGSRAQSRHLMPTAACTMQSGQIGLPQSEQETAVSTLGWLAQYRGPVDLGACGGRHAAECSIGPMPSR